MQLTSKVFLALLLGHLLADFPLQTDRMVEQKRQGLFIGYFNHALIYYLSSATAVGLFTPVRPIFFRFLAVMLALVVIHLILDWAKISLIRSGKVAETAWTFLLDQVLHAATVAGASWVILPSPWTDLTTATGWLQSPSGGRLMVTAIIYIAVIFGGGYVIRYSTQPLLAQLPTGSSKSPEQLKNAGLYIGWLERFLILTALALKTPALVGFILAAKSIVRFPEIRDARLFAEYFLVGTLLSFAIAVTGGFILSLVLYGTFSLDG